MADFNIMDLDLNRADSTPAKRNCISNTNMDCSSDEESQAFPSIPEFKAIYEVSIALTTNTDRSALLSRILDILESTLQMERGTVLLLMPDNTELVVQAAKNDRRQIDGTIKYQRGEGIVGTVVQTGRSVIIESIAADPHFKNRIHRRSGESENCVSFICVPVILGTEVVGTLSVDIPHRLHRNLDYSERTLSIVASLISGYLHAQRLVHLEREMRRDENERLLHALDRHYRPENIIGVSSVMQEVFRRVELLSQSDTTVLLRGPSGTGKERIAAAIHYGSLRRDKPFIKVNCAALSENLIESELFGHERGAFSGAFTRRTGRIEEANGGTLFLDEIGDFSRNTQVKLLRVIQERQFERVGSNQTVNVDIRLITATNRDLETLIETGAFREDLYYRINVFPVWIPPLHERKDDVMPLVNHFIRQFSAKMGKRINRVSTPAINMLMAYHWPGNVRELENCVEYAVLLSTDGVIYGHNLPPTLQVPGASDMTASGGLQFRVETLERDMIVDTLKRTNGNVTAAARELEITVRMIRYKLKNLGIKTRQLVRPSRPSK